MGAGFATLTLRQGCYSGGWRPRGVWHLAGGVRLLPGGVRLLPGGAWHLQQRSFLHERAICYKLVRH